jgi:hypothetical protein
MSTTTTGRTLPLKGEVDQRKANGTAIPDPALLFDN